MVREINLTPILKKIFDFTNKIMPDATEEAVRRLLDNIHGVWSRETILASAWGEKYASTLAVNKTDSGGSVYVNENHANFKFVIMVENGVTGWSIKDALMKSDAARQNEAEHGTRFVRVPFQWATPKSKEGKVGSQFTGVMPKDIYQIVKSGGTLSSNVSEISTGEELHVSGLQRYGSEKHGQYFTFRTVSKKSKGWQYPDKPATPVFDQVLDLVEKMLNETLINMIQGFNDDVKKEFEK